MTTQEIHDQVRHAYTLCAGWTKRQMYTHLTAGITDPVEAAWIGEVAAEYMETHYRNGGTTVHSPEDAVYWKKTR